MFPKVNFWPFQYSLASTSATFILLIFSTVYCAFQQSKSMFAPLQKLHALLQRHISNVTRVDSIQLTTIFQNYKCSILLEKVGINWLELHTDYRKRFYVTFIAALGLHKSQSNLHATSGQKNVFFITALRPWGCMNETNLFTLYKIHLVCFPCFFQKYGLSSAITSLPCSYQKLLPS